MDHHAAFEQVHLLLEDPASWYSRRLLQVAEQAGWVEVERVEGDSRLTVSYEKESQGSLDIMYYGDEVFWVMLSVATLDPEDQDDALRHLQELRTEGARRFGPPVFDGTSAERGFPHQFDLAIRACEWRRGLCSVFATLSQMNSRSPVLVDLQLWREGVLPSEPA
jgi:hypothetical protein